MSIDIPISSSHHESGVHAVVQSHPLNSDGSIFVPADPTVLSWANSDAAPGADRGTAIIAGHINFVINGSTVAGAFVDLAEYARLGLGHSFTVTLRDGRVLRYEIVDVRQYTKEQLAADPSLRASLYNQHSTYGSPPGGRLLLVSCGGPFDPNTGEYEDNVFVYALPVS